LKMTRALRKSLTSSQVQASREYRINLPTL
jgi:hypothetical protein